MSLFVSRVIRIRSIRWPYTLLHKRERCFDGVYEFYSDWRYVLPFILKESFDANCHALVVLSHLQFNDDKALLQIAEENRHGDMLKLVAGGHDHEPHIIYKGVGLEVKHETDDVQI